MQSAILTRFWSKVEKTDGCWIWKASIQNNGYGQFSVRHGKIVLAHRFAYESAHGPIPTDQPWCVCHTCDNKICVNPQHLWLGTSADNTTDKMRKGRGRTYNQKLNRDQVATIRGLHATGAYTHKELGGLFGVNQSTITRIINNKVWKEAHQ